MVETATEHQSGQAKDVSACPIPVLDLLMTWWYSPPSKNTNTETRECGREGGREGGQGGGGTNGGVGSDFHKNINQIDNKQVPIHLNEQILSSDTETLCDIIKTRAAYFNHVNVT